MKNLIIIIIALFIGTAVFAQVPQSMKYQAVARDISGNILANKNIALKISILKGSVSGTVVYSEQHKKSTNTFGLVDLEIGNGSSPSGDFSAINWGDGTYYVKVELDPSGGSSFVLMGTSQLLSVPYALYAGNTKSAGGLTLPFSQEVATTDNAFTITNSTGNGIKGISSLIGSGVYGENTSATGFTTGVFGKSASNSGTGVSGSGVRIGVSGTATATTGNGAFAINGETNSPIGYGVYGGSYSNTGTTYGIYGKVNSPDGFSGYFDGGKFYTNSKVGIGTTSPEFDIDINKPDYASLRLKSATGGTLLVLDQVNDFNNHFSFILFRKGGVNAYYSGMNYDEYEILSCINSKGLTVNKDGYVRISERLHLNDGGRIGIGTSSPGAALHIKATGYPNSFMFLEASAANDAGFRLYEGSTAKWHIFNSSSAGGFQIYNSAGATAIFCKQVNSYVGINTITPNYNLDVNGTAGKTGGGSWSNSSDIRLKNVLGNYSKGLNEITSLQPIVFKYKAGNARNLTSDAEQIGFVAQDVQKVFPETVTEAADGYLDFNIHAINVAMVNAIKELNEKVGKLENENNELKTRLEKIERIIEASAHK